MDIMHLISRRIDDSKYSDTNLPSYPGRTLLSHVAMKGQQVSSLLGLTKVMPYTPILGLVISSAMLYGKHLKSPLDNDTVDDRAYRIYHNKGQNTLDRYSFIGAALGGATGAVIGKFGLRSIMTSTMTGLTLGMGYYLVEKSDIINKIKRITK